ncbi:MAG: hypothetical protein SGCHY_000915 [Lobulomycetales sp.]
MGEKKATTATATTTETTTEATSDQLVIRLHAHAPSSSAEASSARSVQWDDSVVDNEGLGKKSSKVCCIFHKSKKWDESSSESSSCSDSSNSPNEYERVPKRKLRKKKIPRHGKGPHNHADDKPCTRDQ